jgi:hypothetical protein
MEQKQPSSELELGLMMSKILFERFFDVFNFGWMPQYNLIIDSEAFYENASLVVEIYLGPNEDLKGN